MAGWKRGEGLWGERRQGDDSIVMASLHLSPGLCWALGTSAGFSTTITHLRNSDDPYSPDEETEA